jgi:ATPase family associated with various cellular activities (AAA)
MSKLLGVTALFDKKFDLFEFDGKWQRFMGNPAKNFSALIYGDSGNGKTEFCVQLAQYMAGFRKVYYNSVEQGVSRTFQMALRRNNFEEVKGNFVMADGHSFEEMMDYLEKRNAPQVIFIDSIDYSGMTLEQYQLLRKKHPKKVIVLVSWAEGAKPKTLAARAMLYSVDVKIRVKNFIAYPSGRYEGNEPYTIWEEGVERVMQRNLAEKNLKQGIATPTTKPLSIDFGGQADVQEKQA